MKDCILYIIGAGVSAESSTVRADTQRRLVRRYRRRVGILPEELTYHSDGYTEADIIVQACWDADRLDLGRVGMKPAPHRLCTASAKSVDVLEAAYERSV